MTLLDAWREFERNVLPADMPTATRSKVRLAFQLGASEVVDRVIEREIDGEAFVEFYVEIQQELALVARALIEAATAAETVCGIPVVIDPDMPPDTFELRSTSDRKVE